MHAWSDTFNLINYIYSANWFNQCHQPQMHPPSDSIIHFHNEYDQMKSDSSINDEYLVRSTPSSITVASMVWFNQASQQQRHLSSNSITFIIKRYMKRWVYIIRFNLLYRWEMYTMSDPIIFINTRYTHSLNQSTSKITDAHKVWFNQPYWYEMHSWSELIILSDNRCTQSLIQSTLLIRDAFMVWVNHP